MTNAPQNKVTKLFECRTKLEPELNKVQVRVQEANQAFDRHVRVEKPNSTSQDVVG